MAGATASIRATFPACARLHSPSEYASALKGKRLARGALFVVMTPRRSQNPEPSEYARLGLIIAKRFAAKAVVRNAIKRVIREAFRQNRADLPACDLVFRLHTKIQPASLTELKKQVRVEADALLKQVPR